MASKKELIKNLAKERNKFLSLAEDIKKGTIGTYRDAAESLKKIHIYRVLIVNNVQKAQDLSYAELGTIGAALKKQYYQGYDPERDKKFGLKYLFQEAPNQSTAQIENRLRMYTEAADLTAQTIKQSRNILSGAKEMSRLLSPGHIHCIDCLRYADLGWQLIGNLPLPKEECACRANCKCEVLYR